MSRTIPRAYVTAAWSRNPVEAVEEAKKYCRELVTAGYLPLCPVLVFNGVIDEEDPDAEKKKREYYYKPEPVYADEIDDVYGEYDEYDEYEFDTLGRRRW
jgi:dienelactone hydrolase